MPKENVPLWVVRPELYLNISQIEDTLGYVFKEKSLLCEALSHRSALVGESMPESYLKKSRPWNERLEFLGDSVLGLVLSEHLLSQGALSEGEMSKIRSSLVCEAMLAKISQEKLNLGAFVVLGASELRSNGRAKASILADALEALIGAVFSDGGWTKARKVVLSLYKTVLAAGLDSLQCLDHKTVFQEATQAQFHVTPTYDVISESGPAHSRLFEVAVFVDKDGEREEWGRGAGLSKKQAAQAAAAAAVERLKESRQ